MLLNTATFFIIGCTGYLIFKGFQTQTVLAISGCFLLATASLSGAGHDISSALLNNPERAFSLAELFPDIFSKRTMLLALVVIMAGGYARFMVHTGAAHAAVRLTANPLKKLQSPYLAVSLAYVFGQLLNIFIPSAAGLAMLLLVAMYPALVGLGVSPAGAAAVIGTTACLDLGPLSSTSLVAASIADMSVITYFISWQLPVSIPTVLAVAILHYFVQRHFDSRQDGAPVPAGSLVPEDGSANVPAAYAIFPVAPLLLVLFCRLFLSDSGSLLVVGSLLASWFVALAVDGARKRNSTAFISGLGISLAGMWTMFRKVVTLIVAAQIFTAGIWATGILHSAIDMMHGSFQAENIIITVLILMTGTIALISGSGNAAFISLSGFVSKISTTIGVQDVALALPMQLSSGMFRSMSPVAAVIIIVAGASGVSPIEIIKRTFLPMAGGIVVMTVLTGVMNN